MLLLCAVLLLAPHAALAADPPAEIPDGTCTSQEEYFPVEENLPSGTGLISSIIEEIKTPMNTVAQAMFEGIAGDAGFQNVLRLACSIYVAIYGILFTFGMVQITIHDLMVRLVKLGIINMLLSANAWGYFYDIVVHFFNDGVDDIILRVSNIAFDTGTGAGALVGQPFDPMDQALVFVVSSKMAVTLIATFTTGPYGFIIGLILVMALGSFLKSIFNALWVYVMAFVIRTIMFGMAPLFIVCILFSRTRHLFDGWLNQIMNASLQPIFLFTFFAFFVLLIKSCVRQLFEPAVCWMPTRVNTGAPGVPHMWTFGLKDCGVFTAGGEQSYVPFDGRWSFDGPQGIGDLASCNTEIHPIGIILPLMIWILADLANRFNHIVIEIAKDLSNAATDLTMGSDSVKRWFNQAIGGGKSAGGDGPARAGGAAAGLRPGSGGTLGDVGKLIGDGMEQARGASSRRGAGSEALVGGRTSPPPAKPGS